MQLRRFHSGYPPLTTSKLITDPFVPFRQSARRHIKEDSIFIFRITEPCESSRPISLKEDSQPVSGLGGGAEAKLLTRNRRNVITDTRTWRHVTGFRNVVCSGFIFTTAIVVSFHIKLELNSIQLYSWSFLYCSCPSYASAHIVSKCRNLVGFSENSNLMSLIYWENTCELSLYVWVGRHLS
jgi:hypothetical protein